MHFTDFELFAWFYIHKIEILFIDLHTKIIYLHVFSFMLADWSTKCAKINLTWKIACLQFLTNCQIRNLQLHVDVQFLESFLNLFSWFCILILTLQTFNRPLNNIIWIDCKNTVMIIFMNQRKLKTLLTILVKSHC